MALVVERDGEAVRLLLDLADQGEHCGVGPQVDLMPLGGGQRAGAVAVVLDHAVDRQRKAHLRRHALGHGGVGRAAVDEHQIRQRGKFFIPVQIALQPSPQHLLHRGVIVRMLGHGLHLKAAVVPLEGLRPGVDHHGRDDVACAGVGDVVGFDARGRRVQLQHLGQQRQRAALALGQRGHTLHLLAGIALRHGKQLRLLPPLGHMHADLAPGMLAQHGGQLLRILDHAGQQDLPRQHSARQIVLRQQRREHGLLRFVGRRGKHVRFPAGHAAVLHMDQGIAALRRAAVHAPHVRVGADAGDNLLPLAQHLDGVDAVAQGSGLFKAQLGGLPLHLLAHGTGQLPIVSGEQLRGLFDAALILRFVRHAAAKCVAPAHVMVQAGALPADVTREDAGAGGQLERGAHRVDRAARLVSPAERAEVARAVVRGLVDHRKARIAPLLQAHKGIALVVLEQDIVARHMLLDERILQDQRLKLRGDEDRIKVVHLGHHAPRLFIV